MNASPSKRAWRAFTLLELLVVIVVIAVLTALLLPAIGTARNSARVLACKSNLRQTGLGLCAYAADFNAYPMQGWFYNNGTIAYFDGLQSLLPYCGGNSNIYACPAGPPPFRDRAGYRYNDLRFGLGSLDGGDYPSPVRDSDVVAPQDMLAIGDMDGDWGDCIAGFGWPGWASSQHRDRRSCNAVFCDGHVETSYVDRIPTVISPGGWPPREFLPDETRSARWNRDHQPHREDWPMP